MKKISIKHILISIILLLTYGCWSGEQKMLISKYTLSDEELSSLQSGDIIFRMGYGGLSLAIVGMLNDTVKLSHCGVVVRDSSGLSVIHTISPSISDADGMQQCSMEEFIADSRENSIAAVRFKNGSGQNITAKAAYYLSKQVPFDIRFDLTDSSAFFCSELPIRILKDEFDFDVLQGKELMMKNCKFSLFFNLQHFKPVIYHLSR